MDNVKGFLLKNKKIAIPAAIILVLFLAVGIYFISQPNNDTDRKPENQTEEKIDASANDEKEDDKSVDITKDESEQAQDDAEIDTAPVETPTETPASTPTESPASKPADKPSNNKHNSSNNNNSNTSNSQSSESKPAHSHDWKDHTATKQVWVSNIVPVYETQKVQVGTKTVSDGWYWHCSGCGAEMPIGQDTEHIRQHLLAGEMSNGYDFEKTHQEPIYEEQQVQVGTKDEGHYENQSYVDYQYCDCGARQ